MRFVVWEGRRQVQPAWLHLKLIHQVTPFLGLDVDPREWLDVVFACRDLEWFVVELEHPTRTEWSTWRFELDTERIIRARVEAALSVSIATRV